jgi:hypothetical protein
VSYNKNHRLLKKAFSFLKKYNFEQINFCGEILWCIPNVCYFSINHYYDKNNKIEKIDTSLIVGEIETTLLTANSIFTEEKITKLNENIINKSIEEIILIFSNFIEDNITLLIK